MVQQAPMYRVRKTRCGGTQIQTSTSKRGTMGPRNKCGDDKIGCIFSLKLAPMGLDPGLHDFGDNIMLQIIDFDHVYVGANPDRRSHATSPGFALRLTSVVVNCGQE
jgi:hypothetical protein